MFEGHFRRRVLLCLVVNAILVAGSPRTYSNGVPRRIRHASCSSCRRDRPSALANWYAPPSSGEYRGGDSETSGWPSGQQFQPSASFNSNPYSYNPPNPYIRAPGGRGGPGINRSGGTCKRENPFEPRNVNSNVAAAPAAPVHGLVTPATPYQPRRPMSRSLDRSSYRKPNFHDLIKRQFETPVNEEYPEYDTPIARPSLEDPTTKLGVVYRADKQDVDPDEDEHGYLYPSDYPRPLDFPLPDERGQAPQMAQRFVQPHSDQRQYGMIDGFGQPQRDQRDSIVADRFGQPQRDQSRDYNMAERFVQPQRDQSRDSIMPDRFVQPQRDQRDSIMADRFDQPQRDQRESIMAERFVQAQRDQRDSIMTHTFDQPQRDQRESIMPERFVQAQRDQRDSIMADRFDQPQRDQRESIMAERFVQAQRDQRDSIMTDRFDQPQRDQRESIMAERFVQAQRDQRDSIMADRFDQPQRDQRESIMAERFVQAQRDQRDSIMAERFDQPKSDQSRDYSMVHVPEVRFNPYNLPPELNVLKLMQTINRDGIVVGNDSTWEDQKLEAERSSPKVVENDDVEEAGAVKEMNDSDHANGGFDSQEEKLPEKFQERRDLEDWGVHAEKLEVQQVSISTESLLVESSTESSILDLSNREYKLMA
ncbi:PREDICTED: uncharacterized protein LOC107186941 [Dufourea novaeangliae]|uniref:uncharacterized protein LOC107186941 n=1 Tax=Dufourea novaeangliae TaxID=178035 RepID=UPI0007677C74|nr:PREDICTED: uncharacterized protein LOC107186941 [Dufourea novaeangliae]